MQFGFTCNEAMGWFLVAILASHSTPIGLLVVLVASK